MKEALPIQFQDVKHCFADLLSPAQLDALIEISQIVSKHLAEKHSADSDKRSFVEAK